MEIDRAAPTCTDPYLPIAVAGLSGQDDAVLQLRNITFMTDDPARLADFWQAALGLPERQTSVAEVLLADAEWGFPRFTFQQVRDAPHRPSALHLDLTPEDRISEVERLVELGAVEGATHGDDDFRWTVMQDPDGNEFCVTD
jgi:catechol 2,3-dioxygenase-like lactoylglutathione lyase family enzyme